jgi:hypothetical protein
MGCRVGYIDLDRIPCVFECERDILPPQIGAEQRDLVEIGQGERGICPGKSRIEFDRTLKKPAGLRILRGFDISEVPHSAVVAFPRVQTVRRLA